MAGNWPDVASPFCRISYPSGKLIKEFRCDDHKVRDIAARLNMRVRVGSENYAAAADA